MKRIYLNIILLLMLITNTVYAFDTDGNHRTITIAGDNNLPPFEYMDNKVYKGFNLDIMRAVALEVGIDIEILPMKWYKAIEALNKGEVDAIQGMKYSSMRDINYDFTKPYIQTAHAIFVSSDNKYIYDLDDLQNKMVAIQKNDISKYLLNSRGINNLIEVDNQEVALMMLKNEKIDAYVGNKLTGQYYIQKKDYINRVKTVGSNLMEEDYCVATIGGNDEVIEIFNQGLKIIIENGTYDKIYKKWFGEKFYDNARKLRKYILVLGIAFIIVLLIIVAIFKWNRELKKKVDERTIELKSENILKQKILDSIFSAIVVIDKEKVIIRYNDMALRYMKNDDYYLDRTILSEIIMDRDLALVLEEGRVIKAREVSYCSDRNNTYQYNISPIEMDNGIKGAVISVMDITEEKLLRESLIAEDKLKSLGRIAATVAHEIKNPLTSIKAYVELIPYKIESQKFRDKLLEDVPKEIDRLDNFINDLLNYSSPNEIIKEDVRLSTVVDNTIRLIRREATKKRVSIISNIDNDTRIEASRNQIKQVLMNLLLNAIDAVDGIEEPCIKITLQDKEDYIRLIIEDNGIGIEGDIADRIFEPYYTTKEKGIGLGLAITEKLIKKNQGEIMVTSKKGLGTTFTITFKKAKTYITGE